MRKQIIFISVLSFLTIFSCTNNDQKKYKEISFDEAYTIKEEISSLYENGFILPEDICFVLSINGELTDDNNNKQPISVTYEFHSILSKKFLYSKQASSVGEELFYEEYAYYKDESVICAYNEKYADGSLNQYYSEYKCNEEEFLPYLDELGYNTNGASSTVIGINDEFFNFVDSIYSLEHESEDNINIDNNEYNYNLTYKTKGEGSLRVEGNIIVSSKETNETTNTKVLIEMENNLPLIYSYSVSSDEKNQNYCYSLSYNETECVKYPDLSSYEKKE